LLSITDDDGHTEQHHHHHHQEQQQQQHERAEPAAGVKDSATVYRPWEVNCTDVKKRRFTFFLRFNVVYFANVFFLFLFFV